MKIANQCELLDTDLLTDSKKLKEISHWLNVFNRPNGWHYDLDLIWIMNKIEEMKLPKGITILDAGAGLGVAQFILAARGYNIISLDFCDRVLPKNARKIFNITCGGNGDFKHSYINHIEKGYKKTNCSELIKKLLCKAFRYKSLFLYKIREQVQHYVVNFIETHSSHLHYGNITFFKGSFNKIDLYNNSIDLVICVSAFEHNDYSKMQSCINEFNRVLKPDSKMLVTTSCGKADKDFYDDLQQGWCFTLKTLSQLFSVSSSSFDYDAVYQKVINSKVLKKRLSSYYRYSDKTTVPEGDFSRITYIPVAICREKR